MLSNYVFKRKTKNCDFEVFVLFQELILCKLSFAFEKLGASIFHY